MKGRSRVGTVVLHALLCLLPVAILTLPLLARRYPGERLLLTLGSPRPRRFARAHSTRRPARSRSALLAVRGGLLLACSLAVRPPPASQHVTR
jgi:hypothetical protein